MRKILYLLLLNAPFPTHFIFIDGKKTTSRDATYDTIHLVGANALRY